MTSCLNTEALSCRAASNRHRLFSAVSSRRAPPPTLEPDHAAVAGDSQNSWCRDDTGSVSSAFCRAMPLTPAWARRSPHSIGTPEIPLVARTASLLPETRCQGPFHRVVASECLRWPDSDDRKLADCVYLWSGNFQVTSLLAVILLAARFEAILPCFPSLNTLPLVNDINLLA